MKSKQYAVESVKELLAEANLGMLKDLDIRTRDLMRKYWAEDNIKMVVTANKQVLLIQAEIKAREDKEQADSIRAWNFVS